MRHRRKRKPTRRRRCRGVAAVEAAITLPVVVLLLFGFVELGWQVNNVQILHNAARQGARAAVRLENSNAEVKAAVLNSLQKSIDVDPGAVTVGIAKLNHYGHVDYQVQSLDENEQGDAIRVTVTVNSAYLGLPSDFLGLAVENLSGSAIMQRRK